MTPMVIESPGVERTVAGERVESQRVATVAQEYENGEPRSHVPRALELFVAADFVTHVGEIRAETPTLPDEPRWTPATPEERILCSSPPPSPKHPARASPSK